MVYEQKSVEQKWQKKWQKMSLYSFVPDSDKPVYSIDNPPRYASGALHVGHAVHYTHIDFAARYRRMKGFNVFFPLCFDCNGIPIEERVEKKLGITRKDIDRHKFIKLCSEFANEKIDEMKTQFILLGESMDPSVYYQTDEENYRRLTQLSFIELYTKGLIYKGEHPINWCPRCMTALADAEIEYKNRETKLNYIKFKLEDEDVIIATTRPELLCTCQLVAIHPDDFRAEKLKGKKLKTPLFEKEVRIVGDKNVDPNFGSGIVMICSIGDKDDLEWIFKYKLKIEKGIDEEGRMTGLCGKYRGMKVSDARKAIIDDMKKQGLLIKQEGLEQSIGTCWRCHTPVEFLVMPQWFLKTVQFKEKMLKEIEKLDWKPRFMKRRLQDWINSLSWDWVISRQRYFATPIPIWECKKCGNIVVAKKNECYVDPTIMDKECPECRTTMKGCEDVFDTWMDSSISPLFNTCWERNPDLFKKLYPMSLRPQAHDIIRTWAFYTILRGILLTNKLPFKTIMVDGFVLAPDGKPMHASLGNVIDPLKILEKYGSDAFRYYAATCAVGEDNSFREKDVIHGMRLCTKLWNVSSFVKKIIDGKKIVLEKSRLKIMDRWILSKYSKVVENATEYMDEFRFDKAMKEIEEFLWHEFADHYIEIVKHRAYDNDESAISTLYTVCSGVVKLMAPMMPHIAEEIYTMNFKDAEGDPSIHISSWPKPVLTDEDAERKGELVKEIVSKIRGWKSEKGMSLSKEIDFVELVCEPEKIIECKEDIARTVRAKELVVAEKENLKENLVAVKPVYSKIGPVFKGKAEEIVEKLKTIDVGKLSEDEVNVRLDSGETVKLTKDFINFEKTVTVKGKKVDVLNIGDTVALIGRV